jgi:hypothetical protein
MPFIAWPEIEGFHNIRKFVRVDPAVWFRAVELLHGTSTVHYKAKVKLHGTNAAIQWTPEGEIVCQSRTNIITPENDNAGFARWVKENEREFKRLQITNGMVVFGEWCGPGIQKGVAISEIPKRVFAVFAIRPMNNGNLIVEPNQIKELIGDLEVDGLYILPWYEKEIDINWRQTDEELTKNTAVINDWVAAVEANDPWVETVFNVKGTGEGLVFYPTSLPHVGFESFTYLTFKAKGEKHKNIKTAAPAQVNPETAASVDAFVELVLTPARLEQGARAIMGEHKHEDKLTCLFCIQGKLDFDMKLTGKFVTWIENDIKKECQDEMEASKLEYKQIQKILVDKARSWYLGMARR